MSLVCLGLSHHETPTEVRERHAFPRARMAEALIALRDYEEVREAAMLSTCNRLEIYAEIEHSRAGIEQLKEFLVNFRHGDVAYDLEPYLYTLEGNAAGEHLMRVATGLDSMLIGEAEILGQIKDAYHQAQRAQSLGNTLHRLFREAINAGKAARSQTAIGNESVSVATAAIALAKEHVGSLEGKTILLVGAGKMGQTAAKRLKSDGARSVLVVNRTHERARELVARLGMGEAIELPALVAAIGAADIVITSTDASHFVLTPENVGEAMLGRLDRPLFIIDIAVPRDVDPEVALIPGVRVTDIDQLSHTIDVTLEHRRAAIPFVEEIIGEHVMFFDRWYQAQPVVPVIASLTRKAEAIREGEAERLFSRCPNLSERERMLITGMSLTIVSKLLHSAVARIRHTASADRAEAVLQARLIDALFELQSEPFVDEAQHPVSSRIWNTEAG